MRPRAVVAGLIGTLAALATPAVVGTSCGEPTCETACNRVFYTCGFDYFQEGTTTEDHVGECIDACRQGLEIPSREEETVTWAMCVSTFPCEDLAESDPNGFAIREACPPDSYYLGDLYANDSQP